MGNNSIGPSDVFYIDVSNIELKILKTIEFKKRAKFSLDQFTIFVAKFA